MKSKYIPQCPESYYVPGPVGLDFRPRDFDGRYRLWGLLVTGPKLFGNPSPFDRAWELLLVKYPDLRCFGAYHLYDMDAFNLLIESEKFPDSVKWDSAGKIPSVDARILTDEDGDITDIELLFEEETDAT